jgi:hypothetical protein
MQSRNKKDGAILLHKTISVYLRAQIVKLVCSIGAFTLPAFFSTVNDAETVESI